MSDIQSCFDLRCLDYGIPSDDYSRFVVRFVDHFLPFINIEDNDFKVGRPSFKDSDMIKLLLYAFHDRVTDSEKIAEYARFHQIYRYVSNDIRPSARTIRRFIQNKGQLFVMVLGLTLLFALELEITDFKEVCVDGTVKKANNNKFNVMDENTINTLILHYSGMELNDDEIKELSRPAKKFIKRNDLSDECKIELLKAMNTQLHLSGQNTVPANDVEARWMKNKKGLKEPSYNVQSAVDTKSKLICAVKVSQNPTDHYELPSIVKQLIENTETVPEQILADTGYHNQISFDFLRNNNLKGLIPDRRQTREKTGRISENPFHKDHFKYNYDEDAFICPNGEKLEYKYQFKEKTDGSKNKNKIRRIYMNYDACKDCKDKNKCYKGNSRQISEYVDEYALKMKETMDSEEGSETFKKRSRTVEAPFGTLKFNYNIDNMQINGIKHTEEVLNLLSSSYNLTRLHHIIQKELTKEDDIELFKETIEILLNLDCKINEIH